jgi:hypothetical protein
VKNDKQFGPKIITALAVTALVGMSAFAESRPGNETNARSSERTIVRRDGGSSGNSAQRVESTPMRRESIDRRSSDRATPRSEGRGERSVDRERVTRNRGEGEVGRDHGSRGGDRNRGTVERPRSGDRNGSYRGRDGRNGSRDGSWRGGRGSYPGHGNRSYGHGTPYYHHGRVSSIRRYGSGFRIWIVGAPYPFFVPEAYYYRHHFRVGLSIRLGGYYNPLGYYDYYDDTYYDRGYSRGVLRGEVESVDQRRDTIVLRNEATGSFVTVQLSGRDRNRDLRPGDYVEVSGEWGRSGYFRAYDLDMLDGRSDRYDRDDRDDRYDD